MRPLRHGKIAVNCVPLPAPKHKPTCTARVRARFRHTAATEIPAAKKARHIAERHGSARTNQRRLTVCRAIAVSAVRSRFFRI
jgi:hypothetical protein